jgi:ammonia channel protein AmtB
MAVLLTQQGKRRNEETWKFNTIVFYFSGLAALALINTHAAAAVGLVTWVAIDAVRGHISISGACAGPIVGLVAITPACGFVQPGWALFIGITVTCIVYGLLLLKKHMHYDDTLDVAIVHGCGRRNLFIFLYMKMKQIFSCF